MVLSVRLIAIVVLLFAVSGNVFAQANKELGETTYIDLVPPFVVNYGGQGRIRFVRTKITLRVRVGEFEQDVRRHVHPIRHLIVMGISGADADTVETTEGQKKLRKQLLDDIRDFLEKETGKQGVADLLFQTFLVQR